MGLPAVPRFAPIGYFLPLITETNAIQSVLFGMKNMTCFPFFSAKRGDPYCIPVMTSGEEGKPSICCGFV
jgi:hypothetical protein